MILLLRLDSLDLLNLSLLRIYRVCSLFVLFAPFLRAVYLILFLRLLLTASEIVATRPITIASLWPLEGDLTNRLFAPYGLMRTLFPSWSIMTLAGMDSSILKGKALPSTKCFGRYMKYFPSFLLQIRPFASATTSSQPV